MDDKKLERLLVIGLILAVVLFCVCACNSILHISDLDWESKGVKSDDTQFVESSFTLAGATLASGIVGGLASIGSGLFNWWNSKNTQEETWEREDTAVQRRAADLEAAGLSKTLAAGSAATTTATSAPQYTGHGIQDALAAAANIQGIKNAQQENANMKKSYQVMNSQIDQNYADMQKKNAEANYFNSMANKALIDGQVSSYMGLKTLQDIAESQERTLGYKYTRNETDSRSELNVWRMMREAAELDLILGTGQNSSVGGFANGVLRLGGQMMNNLMNTFKSGNLSAARGYHFPEKVR